LFTLFTKGKQKAMLNIISITKLLANQVTKQKYNDDATPREKIELTYSDHYITSIKLILCKNTQLAILIHSNLSKHFTRANKIVSRLSSHFNVTSIPIKYRVINKVTLVN
jgi:hypothetical protein